MNHPDQLLEKAIQKIDAANRQDPNQDTERGKSYPKEWLYAERMTRWIHHLVAKPSHALQLAARAQHISRWMIARSQYPMDRVGYLKWRTHLKQFHAEQTSAILKAVGYDAETIKRVEQLIKKDNLKTDPEAQTIEDAACLIFLEHGLSDFIGQHDESKIIDILQKTWKKMSAQGRQKALSLSLPPAAGELLKKALPHAAA